MIWVTAGKSPPNVAVAMAREPRDDESDDMSAISRRLSFRIDPGISYGNILIAAPLIVGIIYSVGGRDTDLKTTQAEVAKLTAQIEKLRSDMAGQIAELKTSTSEQIRGVRSDIANLPDIRATMGQMEQRLGRDETRLDALAARIEAVDKAGTQNSADLVGILRNIAAMQATKK